MTALVILQHLVSITQGFCPSFPPGKLLKLNSPGKMIPATYPKKNKVEKE